jgi:hypothetical protein
MTFTGTLIEDLMAAVERAEQVRQAFRAAAVEASNGETLVGETLFLSEASLVEPWFASVQENAEYDPKILGVA